MKLCCKNCIPCCDFCHFAHHEMIILDNGTQIKSGPDYCLLHNDQEHTDECIGCGYCEDFDCFNNYKKGKLSN